MLLFLAKPVRHVTMFAVRTPTVVCCRELIDSACNQSAHPRSISLLIPFERKSDDATTVLQPVYAGTLRLSLPSPCALHSRRRRRAWAPRRTHAPRLGVSTCRPAPELRGAPPRHSLPLGF